MPMDFHATLDLYRSELLDRTIPFWLKYGVDWRNGGISTCISDDGRVLSGDKYVWSQLRAVWTFSALYNRIERKQEYLDAATHIFNFIKRNGRNDQGEWYFCLDQDGKPLFDRATSIYCDGFAMYGFAEYAQGDRQSRSNRPRARDVCQCPAKACAPGFLSDPSAADSVGRQSTWHLDDLLARLPRIGPLLE